MARPIITCKKLSGPRLATNFVRSTSRWCFVQWVMTPTKTWINTSMNSARPHFCAPVSFNQGTSLELNSYLVGRGKVVEAKLVSGYTERDDNAKGSKYAVQC